MDNYEDTFAFVQYHLFDGSDDPWSDQRWMDYGNPETPTAIFSAIDMVRGAVEDVDNQYRIYRTNHLLPQRGLPTDVTIDLSVSEVSPSKYGVSATVGIEAGGTDKTLRIFIVHVLDYWPADPSYQRNGFKGAGPTTDINLVAGTTQLVEGEIVLDADQLADLENVKVIVWAQVMTSDGPSEVLQAAVRRWPLVPPPDDDDGDGIVDSADNCPQRANPTQADADDDGVGDLCDNCLDEANSTQVNRDEDSFGDACDNCPDLHHEDQADNDADTIGNPCDACPDVPSPAGVRGSGRPLGAIDPDCDVDRFDLVLLRDCMVGPGVASPPGICPAQTFSNADVDHDDDVDMHDTALFGLNYTGPLTSPDGYIGVDGCIECHPEQHNPWIETIHATAFDTLIASGDGDNEVCFPCHSVGYGEPSGFVNLDTTPELADVQCESCHGPGSNHAIDPEDVPLDVDFESNLCGICHQSCHGACGDEHHPQFEQWGISMHASALADLRADPQAEDSCLECHATDYRLAPEDDKPTLATALHDVECVACHSPHGSAQKGQLRLKPRDLCADCHHMGELQPDETPHQPQAEVLHGAGGFKLDGGAMSGPHSEHWWGIANECMVCHVFTQSYGGPDQPVDSGHTFVANVKACAPCHEATAATLMLDDLRYEMETRVAEIHTYLDPSHPNYVDPGSLSSVDRARHTIAVFNTHLVEADRSNGSHNPPYTRALLAEAEHFFGIEPWKRARTVASHPLAGGRERSEIQP